MDERNYYPLSREQQGLVKLFGFFPDRQILNISARIDFETVIDEPNMLRALDLTVARLPYCRVRVHEQDENTTVQYVSDEAPEPVEVVDVSEYSEDEVDELFSKWSRELFPNDCRDVQLCRFKLLRRKNGYHSMFACVHHFVMDAYALMNTIIYLDKVYSALTEETELPPAGILPWEMLEQETAYFASPRFQEDKAWWAERLKEEPQFTSINGLGYPEFIEGKKYGYSQSFTQLKGEAVEGRIPAELTRKVKLDAKEKHYSPQLFYLLALRSYLGRVSGTDDVIVDTAVARRSTLAQKKSGLSRANALLFRSIIPEDRSFDEALKILDDIQKEMYRHADVLLQDAPEFLNAQHDVPLGCTYHSVWLTYQPYFDLTKSDLKFQAKPVPNGVAAAPLYVYISPIDSSDDLWARYGCAVGYTKPENCLRFHAFMLRFLEKGIAEPGKSIGELIDESL